MNRLRAVLLGSLLAAGTAAADDPQPAWVGELLAPQYFAVYVEDVDRAAAFYTRAFGVSAVGGARAEDGSWRIENLQSEQLLIELIRDARAQKVERALGFRKVGCAVSDVEAVATRIERATGERPRIVDFERFNQRILQLKDPEGNTVQLFSRLK